MLQAVTNKHSLVSRRTHEAGNLKKNWPTGTLFCDLGAVSPHFKGDNGEIWHNRAGLGLPPMLQWGGAVA